MQLKLFGVLTVVLRQSYIMRLIVCCEIWDKDNGDRLQESNLLSLCHAHKASLTYPVLVCVEMALTEGSRSIQTE